MAACQNNKSCWEGACKIQSMVCSVKKKTFGWGNTTVRPHMRYGMSLDSLEAFLECSGYNAELRCFDPHRRPEKLKWVTNKGSLEPVGYDLVEFIKQYTKERGNCSVAQWWGETQPANVFLSHCQQQSLESTLHPMRHAHSRMIGFKDVCSSIVRDEGQLRWWLDYVIIQQNVKPQFDKNEIIEVIGSIGLTLGIYDSEYLARSFCVFEVFETKRQRGKLYFWQTLDGKFAKQRLNDFQRYGHVPEVNVELAECHHTNDKNQIDKYIQETDGFEFVNASVRNVLRKSLVSWMVEERMRRLRLRMMGLCCCICLICTWIVFWAYVF